MRAFRRNTPIRQNDKGTILITTLLVMSVMAALTIAILDDLRFGVKRALNMDDHAQGQWYLRAAEDYARTYLEQQLATASDNQLNAALRTGDPVILPLEGGALSVSVRDGGACFSLGALSAATGQRQFTELLKMVGLPDTDALRLTHIAIDWQDTDNRPGPGGAEDFTYLDREPAYRTPNTAFHSLSELRALDGMSETLYQTLRPFLCARASDVDMAINVNTLAIEQAPLLAVMLGGVNMVDTAAQLIRDRPAEGYENLEAFRASPILEEADLRDASFDSLTFRPELIWVETVVSYGTLRHYGLFEFQRHENGLTRIYKSYNPENLRLIVETDAS